MEEEESPGGSRIYRHEEPTAEPEIVAGDPDLIEAVSDHVETHLGPIHSVMHELVSPIVHIDVLWLRPIESRPVHYLVTCGMSELPMAVPDDLEAPRFVELMLGLPPDWDVESSDERWYWPVRLLKTLARLPHEYGTWLGIGHTIPNGDPAQEYAPGAGFTGAIVLPPLTVPEEFARLERADAEAIEFLAVIPLYSAEMDLKLQRGADALVDAWDAKDVPVSEVVEVGRQSAAGPRRRKRFGLF